MMELCVLMSIWRRDFSQKNRLNRRMFGHRRISTARMESYRCDAFRAEVWSFGKARLAGFSKIDSKRQEFANENFIRGQKHLLKNIRRNKRKFKHSQISQDDQSEIIALKQEIEMLNKKKHALSCEVQNRGQLNQRIHHHLQHYEQKLQTMAFENQSKNQYIQYLEQTLSNALTAIKVVSSRQNDINLHPSLRNNYSSEVVETMSYIFVPDVPLTQVYDTKTSTAKADVSLPPLRTDLRSSQVPEPLGIMMMRDFPRMRS